MVVPYYFKREDEEIVEARERLTEELNVHEDTYVKIRKIHPHVPVFLGNIYNELKSILFC